MSVVRVNAITVPADRADELVARFAARAGEVGKAPGFEAFELLRPTDGRDVFLVYTRWRSDADYRAWLDSGSFARGHGGPPGGAPGGDRPAPVSTAAEQWEFDVVSREEAGPSG